MQRGPARRCGGGTRGAAAGDREAVLRKAVCGRGELPAGGVILWCAAGSPVRASPGGPAVPLPSGMAGGCVRGSQKAVLAMLAGAKIRGRLSRVSSSRR